MIETLKIRLESRNEHEIFKINKITYVHFIKMEEY